MLERIATGLAAGDVGGFLDALATAQHPIGVDKKSLNSLKQVATAKPLEVHSNKRPNEDLVLQREGRHARDELGFDLELALHRSSARGDAVLVGVLYVGISPAALRAAAPSPARSAPQALPAPAPSTAGASGRGLAVVDAGPSRDWAETISAMLIVLIGVPLVHVIVRDIRKRRRS